MWINILIYFLSGFITAVLFRKNQKQPLELWMWISVIIIWPMLLFLFILFLVVDALQSIKI